MSEEAVVETPAVEQTPETPAVQATPEPSPVEVEARDQGWVSKEEWVESGKSADEWRPAKEFVERGELYKSIHQTKRELKQTQAALDALQRHHQMVYDKAYQTALSDLKQQKRQAIREGNLEDLEAVEERIDELQEQRVKEKEQFVEAQRNQSGPPPELVDFQSRNPWYGVDKGMTDDADAAGFVHLKNGGSKETLLAHVEKEMRKRYPEKFGIKRAAPNAVAPVAKQTKVVKEPDVEMDDNEREAMRTFVRMGVMTEQQYKAELKKAKGRS